MAEQIVADLAVFPEFKALAREPPSRRVSNMVQYVVILNFKRQHDRSGCTPAGEMRGMKI